MKYDIWVAGKIFATVYNSISKNDEMRKAAALGIPSLTITRVGTTI